MAEIKLNKRYKYAGDIFQKLISIGFDVETATAFLNEVEDADVVEVKHGEWETVHGVLTPGGDPLKRCPYCKSRESEHLDGVEHPSRWVFCPICGAKMDGKAHQNT